MASWQPPPGGSFKVNCDASVGVSTASIAIVARDWRGIVVLALSKKVNTTIPLQAKVAAIG